MAKLQLQIQESERNAGVTKLQGYGICDDGKGVGKTR